MNNLLFVFLGGGIGSILRYFVSLFIKSRYEGMLPVATLISNVLSCIILGIALSMFAHKVETSSSLRVFLLAGICGGFSTFSTFSYETVELIKGGNILIAAINILVSVILCVGIIYFLTRNHPV